MPDLQELIEPTDEEAANGWTPETLTAYHAERQRAQSGVINFDQAYRTTARRGRANSLYRPLRWRG